MADVQVGVMSEKLSLRLEQGAAGREAVEATVKKLGYGIAPKGQSTGKRKFVLPAAAAETSAHPPCQGSCPLLHFSSISQVGGMG